MEVKYNCILIRFGEIFLKGNNRAYFESLLKEKVRYYNETWNEFTHLLFHLYDDIMAGKN